MNNYYVYFHINPLKNKVFYVGKGRYNRAKSKNKRSIYWKKIVNKYGYVVDIPDQNLTEKEAFEKEIFYINFFGLKNLCNITKGGTGGDTISNHPDREAILKKISNAQKGEKGSNYGGKLKHIEGYIEKQIMSNSKKPLLITDTFTNEKKVYINSKAVADELNVSASNVRGYKKTGWKLKKRYFVEDYKEL